MRGCGKKEHVCRDGGTYGRAWQDRDTLGTAGAQLSRWGRWSPVKGPRKGRAHPAVKLRPHPLQGVPDRLPPKVPWDKVRLPSGSPTRRPGPACPDLCSQHPPHPLHPKLWPSFPLPAGTWPRCHHCEVSPDSCPVQTGPAFLAPGGSLP